MCVTFFFMKSGDSFKDYVETKRVLQYTCVSLKLINIPLEIESLEITQ